MRSSVTADTSGAPPSGPARDLAEVSAAGRNRRATRRRWSSNRRMRWPSSRRPALHHGIDPGAPGERHQIVVHVDAEVLADPEAPGQSVLEDGARVPAGTSQRRCPPNSTAIRAEPCERGTRRMGCSCTREPHSRLTLATPAASRRHRSTRSDWLDSGRGVRQDRAREREPRAVGVVMVVVVLLRAARSHARARA